MDNVSVVAEYDYYTLEQARKIVLAEMAYKKACVKQRRKEYLERRRYFRTQRLVGIGIGVTATLLIMAGVPLAAVFIPPAAVLAFTKKMWLVNDYYRKVKFWWK